MSAVYKESKMRYVFVTYDEMFLKVTDTASAFSAQRRYEAELTNDLCDATHYLPGSWHLHINAIKDANIVEGDWKEVCITTECAFVEPD